MNVKVVSRILEANDRIAGENRKIFKESGIYVLNLMSAPGAGKTTLLETTIRALKGRKRIGVIEGDIETDRDAQRIASHGVPVVQINTKGACHLDANMIREAITGFPLEEIDLLFVENVGNLVCPAEFDVGENEKVMILSVTEGDDKPLKYPLMFQESAALLLNKTDLLPYIDCSMDRIRDDVAKLNPKIKIFETSCRTGEGLDGWYDWLMSK